MPGVPDLVHGFRKPADLPEILDGTVAVGAKALSLPLHLHDEDVAERGPAAGLDVVTSRCLKMEHARLAGGLRLTGFDTGVITSRRR